MDLDRLVGITADELVKRITASHALGIFAKHRAKFEGWLKVELIDILIQNGRKDVIPEYERIDVCFGIENNGVAIELKTLNTNYRDGIAENKNRPITKNIQSVIEDIEKHGRNEFPHKFVIFVIFPLSGDHNKWEEHFSRIEELLDGCCSQRFSFSNGISGRLYYGKVRSETKDNERKRKLESLRKEVDKGLADLEEGRFRDGAEVMAEFRAKLLAMQESRAKE